MFTYRNGKIRTSVRKLVEFLCREGDIRNQGTLAADVETMQAGSRIHRKIQKEQKITYQAEVPLKMEWPMEGYRLILEGRADGIDHMTYGSFTENEQITLDTYLRADPAENREPAEILYYIDEIKGVFQNVLEFTEARPLHLAQAKCYAAMYLIREELDRIGVQITYCNMDTREIKRFRTIYGRQELEEWFSGLVETYKMWADACYQTRELRQASIRDLVFPYSYRKGQKKLVAMIYHSILQKKKAFFQAPTGVGKTISAIYPSLKVLSEDKAEEVYYLTAKTITRTVAEDTLHFLRGQRLRLKSVTLTARERICPQEDLECNPASCDYARGHFDRINDALYDILSMEDTITRDVVVRYSQKHTVCPYQLGLEASAFADFVICDYNYVFDPHVNRTFMAQEGSGHRILLIDEAHNLVERARSMYSADLVEDDLIILKAWIPDSEKSLHKKLRACRRKVTEIRKGLRKAREDSGHATSDDYMEIEEVDRLYFPFVRFLEELQEYLTDHPDLEGRQGIVEVFFRLRHFLGILETMTEGYRIYGMWSSQGFVIRLFCIDPSAQLKEILDGNISAIFFSATLLPMPYYRNLLYGEKADAFSIPSPFDGNRRLICISSDVTSRYSRRNREEYLKILAYLKSNLQVRKGNYMVFFPSYEMMENTLKLQEEENMTDLAEILVQSPSMGEKEKEEFLSLFREERENSLVGFCVLGSIFSEGIDLLGKQLIGVLIVGTGLPGIGMERDIIRDYFDHHGKKGYDYAYRFPGMNKVLQAAGRVIRSAGDVGVITLLDERFLWKENQYLLPEDWDRYYEVNLNNYGMVLRDFWGKAEETGFFDLDHTV